MALYYDLPVFKDVYNLTLSLFELTQHFSREYKFTLGQDMKHDCRRGIIRDAPTNQFLQCQKLCVFFAVHGKGFFFCLALWDCMMLVRSIYRANKCKDRVLYLEQFMDDFEVLKLEIRLCADLHLFSVKQQSNLVLQMETIGKQITGWRNASR